MSSETSIIQRDPIASQTLSTNPDSTTTYHIPNERELKQEQPALSKINATRKIAFASGGSQSIIPTNLPFKPPRSKWKGHPCVTTRQLEKQKDHKREKNVNGLDVSYRAIVSMQMNMYPFEYACVIYFVDEQ